MVKETTMKHEAREQTHQQPPVLEEIVQCDIFIIFWILVGVAGRAQSRDGKGRSSGVDRTCTGSELLLM